MDNKKNTNILDLYAKTYVDLVSGLSDSEQNIFFNKIILEQKKLDKKEIEIPSNIFSKKLTSYESITKYLFENKKLTSGEIANLLNRHQSSIIQTYKSSSRKQKKVFIDEKSTFTIPLKIFENNIGIQESIIAHLKNNYKLNLTVISEIINRNYNTTKSSYRQYTLKSSSKKSKNIKVKAA